MENRNGPLIIAEMFIKLIIYYNMADTKDRESVSTGQLYSLDLFLNISIII